MLVKFDVIYVKIDLKIVNNHVIQDFGRASNRRSNAAIYGGEAAEPQAARAGSLISAKGSVGGWMCKTSSKAWFGIARRQLAARFQEIAIESSRFQIAKSAAPSRLEESGCADDD